MLCALPGVLRAALETGWANPNFEGRWTRTALRGLCGSRLTPLLRPRPLASGPVLGGRVRDARTRRSRLVGRLRLPTQQPGVWQF